MILFEGYVIDEATNLGVPRATVVITRFVGGEYSEINVQADDDGYYRVLVPEADNFALRPWSPLRYYEENEGFELYRYAFSQREVILGKSKTSGYVRQNLTLERSYHLISALYDLDTNALICDPWYEVPLIEEIYFYDFNSGECVGTELGEPFPSLGHLQELRSGRVIIVIHVNAYSYGVKSFILDNDELGYSLSRDRITKINLNYEFAKYLLKLAKQLESSSLNYPGVLSDISESESLLQQVGHCYQLNDSMVAHLSSMAIAKLLSVLNATLVQVARDRTPQPRCSVGIRVIDNEGNPVSGVNVSVGQVGHDWILGINQGNNWRGSPTFVQLCQALRNLGFEWIRTGYYWYWIDADPKGELAWIDQEIRAARDAGLKVIFWLNLNPIPPDAHWGAIPNWIDHENVSQVAQEFRRFCCSISNRYRGLVSIWNLGGEVNDIWMNFPGYTIDDYIYMMKDGIAGVREGDPAAVIMINSNRNPNTYLGKYSDYDFFKYLLEHGVDIDIIGTDIYTDAYDLDEVERILDQLETLGKPVIVGEIGFSSIPSFNLHPPFGFPQVGEESKARFFDVALRRILNHSNVVGFTIWYGAEIPAISGGHQIIDEHGNWLPAAYSLRDLLTDLTTRKSELTDESGVAEFRGFSGEYWLAVPSEICISDVEKLVFNHWEGDWEGTTNNVSLVLDRRKEGTAIYHRYYYITVTSDYGHLGGTGWYKLGDELVFTAPQEDLFSIFIGWDGPVQDPASAITTLRVTGPATVRARFSPNYSFAGLVTLLCLLVLVAIGLSRAKKAKISGVR